MLLGWLQTSLKENNSRVATSCHRVPGAAISLLPHCHLSAITDGSQRAGRRACLFTLSLSLPEHSKVWYEYIFFCSKNQPDSLLPARIKFHGKTEGFPEWRDLGVSYKYQKRKPLSSSPTWVGHGGGKKWEATGPLLSPRVPTTKLPKPEKENQTRIFNQFLL